MLSTSLKTSPAHKNAPHPHSEYSASETWWSDGDSNPGPSACKLDVQPTERDQA
jgi:hypothetical protein